MKKRLLLAAVSAAFVCSAQADPRESYKLLFVPRASGAIAVDGQIDEAAWKGGSASSAGGATLSVRQFYCT